MKILKVNKKGVSLSDEQSGKVDGGFKIWTYRSPVRMFTLSEDEVKIINQDLPDGKKLSASKPASEYKLRSLFKFSCNPKQFLESRYGFKYEKRRY